ncbi:hypothetical protein SAMN05421595_1642 [Austwickia chelonae]|uniref:DUF4439 domain-containing protein n=1 Tax=Austwickia chelonae NBRC 105200 TaxID=1184607 RepID=K6VIH9_9MICO|nr:hypothetical protein [Austwickia chelonae]GAB76514.1 hypothetical protein AUCHE_01_00760 [Austwickia chelonae NBRC 105200]SEW26015.1 hypothetical protein SAMN05421595_1642 [Austwickia chelonae]
MKPDHEPDSRPVRKQTDRRTAEVPSNAQADTAGEKAPEKATPTPNEAESATVPVPLKKHAEKARETSPPKKKTTPADERNGNQDTPCEADTPTTSTAPKKPAEPSRANQDGPESTPAKEESTAPLNRIKPPAPAAPTEPLAPPQLPEIPPAPIITSRPPTLLDKLTRFPVPSKAILPRRRMLVLGGGGLLAILASQVLRVEPTAPDLPLVAHRSLDPRAAAVHRELVRVRRALETARKTTAGSHQIPAQLLQKLHQEQEKVLVARLREFEENPEDKNRFPAVPKPGDGLLLAEAAGLSPEELTELGTLAPEELGLILSLRVQRSVALPTLGGTPDPQRPQAVADARQAARISATLRSAEYGLSTAAARATEPLRRRILSVLGWIHTTRLWVQPSVGNESLPEPSGYPLPAPLTDEESVTALCRRALAALTDGFLAEAPSAAGNTPVLVSLLTWATSAETHAMAFGSPPRAFPGLTRR